MPLGAVQPNTSVDLTQIHGIGPSLALKLVGECGTDLAAWPSSKHFTSWLCLAQATRYRAASCCHRNAPIIEPGGGTAAPCGNHDRSDRYGAGRILPPAVCKGWKSQGCDGHRAQARRAVLQRFAARDGV
ncbi:transposase [Novosphingobium sp. Rr 2-17]|uniref:transposase n=1 Tax=Novosphingobium sp. Rr 2-17 TaxID=555793 RepID=UPI00192AE38F